MHDALVQNLNTSNADRGAPDLERVSRLIVAGELVSAVAHDLRQPVTATEMNVSAALKLLSIYVDNPSSSSAKTALDEIGEALRDALVEQGRMRGALQVLEDLVRQREPVYASVDMVASIQEVVRLVTSELAARRTAIDLQIPTAIPRIAADAALVRQALLNILINALEGTSASDRTGGPISIAVSADGDDAVEIVVTHFGPAQESVAAADSALALARSIAKVHDASFAIAGDPASGITITSRWPVRRSADHPMPADERYVG